METSDVVRDSLAPYFVPPIQVLNHLSSIDVGQQAKFIKNGGRIPMHPQRRPSKRFRVHQAELLALAQRTPKESNLFV